MRMDRNYTVVTIKAGVNDSHVARRSEAYNPSNQVTRVWNDLARRLCVLKLVHNKVCQHARARFGLVDPSGVKLYQRSCHNETGPPILSRCHKLLAQGCLELCDQQSVA